MCILKPKNPPTTTYLKIFFEKIINISIIFLPLWILLILITDGFSLKLGPFKISAHHISNPVIFLSIVFVIKSWLIRKEIKKEFKWLQQAEPVPYDYKTIQNSFFNIYIILGGYVILTMLFTYPLITHFSSAVPGDGEDNPMFLWNLWWIKYALINLKTNPLYTNYIFYPKGVGLTMHTFTFLNGLISIPFQLIWGLIIANNIIIVLSFVLSAFGAYLLINYLIKDGLISFIGGIIFAFCPYKFAHLLGHYNLITTQWIPLYILFLIRMTKESSTINSIGAGIFLLCTALSDFYYLIFLGIFTILYLGYTFVSDKKTIMTLSFLKSCAAFWGTFFIGFLPFLLFAIIDIVKGEYSKVPLTGGANFYVADLLGYLTPFIFNPIFGEYARNIAKYFTGNAAEWTVFTGYTVLTLTSIAILKFFRTDREVKFWTISFIIFFILSLGLYPHILGKEIKIPLPFFFIHKIPLLNNLRVPSRFNIMVMLSCAILSSFALKGIFYRLEQTSKKFLFAGVIIIMISLEYLAIPFPMYDTTPPSVYEKIRADKNKGIVLEIPLGWRDGFKMLGKEDTDLMYFQTIHQRPIFGGMVARFPDNRIKYYRNFPIISNILNLQEGSPQFNHDFEKEKKLAKDFITSYDIDYVIVHVPYINTPVHKYILKILPLNKIYEDNNMIAYKTFKRQKFKYSSQ